MATALSFFFAPEDEVGFFRWLAPHALNVYPVRVPPDWRAFRADAGAVARLPEEACYLAAEEIAPVQVDKVKRGPDKGTWRVDEVRSPVLYFERSRVDEGGALRSGRLWAEAEITAQTGRRDPAPERFRRLVMEVEDWFKRTCRRSAPKGYWIGPAAARQFKEGLALRGAGPKGPEVEPYR